MFYVGHPEHVDANAQLMASATQHIISAQRGQPYERSIEAKARTIRIGAQKGGSGFKGE
jgi:hypothetical protein